MAASTWHDVVVVDINELLPRSRSPRDYLNLVTDPRADQEVLRALAVSPHSFVRRAVAEHPFADATTLGALSTQGLKRWDRQHLLAVIAGHPGADRPVLLRVLRQVLALLNEPDGRPYAAALALARRPELDPDMVVTLGHQPGASRRMRRGLRRALAARRPADNS